MANGKIALAVLTLMAKKTLP